MRYLVLLIFPLLSTSNCETLEQDSKTRQIIELIKQQLNIYSLECDFTVISEYFYIPELSQVKNASFIISGNDFFAYYPVEMSFEHKRRIKEDKTERNLSNIIRKSIGMEEVKTKVEVYQGFYIHNGTIEVRNFRPHISFRDNDFQVSGDKTEIRIWKDKWYDLSQLGDPRWLIGYIGLHLSSPNEKLPRRKIVECLDKPGKFYFYEKDNYKIFWKECYFDNSNFEELSIPEREHVSFEVWLDNSNNIVKIVEGIFPARSYGFETVKEICKKHNFLVDVNCDYPRYITREFEFSDFREFDNNVKVPLTGKVTAYQLSIKKDAKERYEIFRQQLEKNEISEIEIDTLFSLFVDPNDKKFKNIIKIHPETLKINQHIPEQTFIPPEPTIKEEEKSGDAQDKTEWYEQYKSAVFVAIFVIFTFTMMLFTKRYLGWGN